MCAVSSRADATESPANPLSIQTKFTTARSPAATPAHCARASSAHHRTHAPPIGTGSSATSEGARPRDSALPSAMVQPSAHAEHHIVVRAPTAPTPFPPKRVLRELDRCWCMHAHSMRTHAHAPSCFGSPAHDDAPSVGRGGE